jgi:hypothetical protein
MASRPRSGHVLLGGGEQVLALAGAFDGQRRVAAAHQSLAGVVRVGDLEQVVLVEQGQLDRALLDQGLDLRGAQRADPVQAGRAQLAVDAGAGEHAAVPDQTDPGQPEPLLEFLDLCGQGGRVGGVAVEHLDRHRDAVVRAQQPVDDLPPAAHPVPGVADLAERAGAALECRRGHVVEDQGVLGQVPGRERGLDPVLAVEHPVHRGVQVVCVAARDAQHRAQRAGGGLGAQRAGDRQLRGRVDHLCDQHGQHQIPLPGPRRVDQLRNAEPVRGAQHRGDVAVRQAAGDLERGGQVHPGRQPLQHPGQRVDLVCRPPAQVGQGAVLDLAAVPVALPQQDRRGRSPIRHPGHVHVYQVIR